MGSDYFSGKSRCKISFREIEEDPGAFRELVVDPKFVCRKCRRIASHKDNLCKAKKLKSLESSKDKA